MGALHTLWNLGGGGINILQNLKQYLFKQSPYFNTTEVIDYNNIENFDLIGSNCIYAPGVGSYFEYQDSFDIDSDFKFEFYCKPDNVGAGSTDNLINKYSTKGFRFYPVRLGVTQILLNGASQGATFTNLENLSTSVFTKVTIERVGNSMTIHYNDVLKSTINLAPYGSLVDAQNLRFGTGLVAVYNLKVWQGSTLIIDCPCSEGLYSGVSGGNLGLWNFAGSMIQYNNQLATEFNGYYQNNYHFNILNGFTLYVTTNTFEVFYKLPFANGSPQAERSDLKYTTAVPMIKVADYYPGFNNGVETKIKFKTDLLSLTDRTFYLNGSGVPQGISFKDLHSREDKIFVDKSAASNPKILTYLPARSSSDSNKIKAYVHDNPIEIWIVAGQSNSIANSLLSELDAQYKGENIYVKVWNVAGQLFKISNTIANISTNENPKSAGNFGIVTPFASLRANSNRHVYVINFGLTGAPIYDDGTVNNWNISRSGGLYSQLLTQIDNALTAINAKQFTYVLKGLIWYQGEADSADATRSAQYKQNTLDLLNGLRTHLSYNIPIYLGKISTNNGAYSVANRTSQSQIASELPQCVLIDTDTMSYKVDNVHLSTTGKIQFAQAINNLL